MGVPCVRLGDIDNRTPRSNGMGGGSGGHWFDAYSRHQTATK